MSSEIRVDANTVLNLFKELDPRKQKTVHRRALRQSGNILAKQTRNNLKSVVKSRTNKKSEKTGKTMNSGVKVRVDRDVTKVSVSILSDFRLKWFEGGTVPRQTKKGYSRGEMKPTYFFSNAFKETKEQMVSELDKLVAESIIKVYQKYNK